MTFKRTIMILADGCRPDVLEEEMAKGHLPNLSRLSESGTRQRMLTCFPSTTGPAYLPYLTGCHPGTCNVPGIRWFDKPQYAKTGWGFKSFRSYCGLESFLLNRDVRDNIESAWEIFPKSFSINNGVTKGIRSGGNLTALSRIVDFYYAHLTDRWHFLDRRATDKLVNLIRHDDFEFVFIVWQSVDEFSHRSSPLHDKTRESYHMIDGFVGELREELKRKNQLEDTLIVLVSDHGLSETHTHFDVGPWLESQKKIKTFYYSNIFKFNFDAVSMISGNGMANLYFKGQNGWGYRKTFEEISHASLILDELRFRPEIDLVVTEGADGSIHFQNGVGHGSFRYDSTTDRIFYKIDRQLDPLGVFDLQKPSPADGFSMEDSKRLTFLSHYPDVFYQMYKLFQSPRTGDVVISARSGFDLREKFEHPLHKGSHGSICPEHMFVPLVMNAKIDRKFVRSQDVFPTVLKLMVKDVPIGIDGVSLI